MKKVLIIGSLGMLGQELVRVFESDKKYEVIAWDKDDIDITDQVQVRKKIGQLKPDIIVNATGYNAVDRAEEPREFELARELNALAPGYLAEIAKTLGAVFINYSSDYVFDGENPSGYKENFLLSPVSNYGRSKAMGEAIVQKIGGKYYIIRLQKLFGRPAQSLEGKKSFFETMLELAKTKKTLELVNEEVANFTYAPDLARQTKYLLENNFAAGIYHITNEGKPVNWYGAAKILFDLAGNKEIELLAVPSSKFPRPARRPRYSILINTKLPALRPWPEALKEFLESKG